MVYGKIKSKELIQLLVLIHEEGDVINRALEIYTTMILNIYMLKEMKVTKKQKLL